MSFQPTPHTPDMRPLCVPENIEPFGEGADRKRRRSIEDDGNRNRKHGWFPPQEQVLSQQSVSPVGTQPVGVFLFETIGTYIDTLVEIQVIY